MNTEINFIEKKPTKYLVPLVFGSLLLLLLLLIISVLIFQQQNYTKAIDVENQKINQYEILIQEHSQESATVSELRTLKEAITTIQSNSLPNVNLYRHTINELDSTEQLSSFTYSNGEQFVLEASFENLDLVADYVSALLEQSFIINADLTSVKHTGELYQAVLSFNVDVDALREELGRNE